MVLAMQEIAWFAILSTHDISDHVSDCVAAAYPWELVGVINPNGQIKEQQFQMQLRPSGVTTLWGKKIAPFYFCNNFVKPHYHRRWSRRNFVKMYDVHKTRMIGLPYGEQELSCRKQIARYLHTQNVEGIYRPNYPWPWNQGQGSLKITVNRTIGQIIHDLVLIELFNGEYYRDLEMWVRGQSRSLKMARFDRPCMTFY